MPRPGKPPPERPLILVDLREKLPWQFSPAVDVQRATIGTADYTLAGMSAEICIERKSKQDLIMSVASKERERFFDSCRRMMDYEHRLIVVECYPSDIWGETYRSQASPLSVMASTWAIWTDYKVPTLWCENARDAARQVEWMLTRFWKKMQAKKKELVA